MSHERDNTGGRSGHLEEGVLEEVLGSGSLRGFTHKHPVQEGSQDRGHLRSPTRLKSGYIPTNQAPQALNISVFTL